MEIKSDDEEKWNINVDSERTFFIEELIDKFIKIQKNAHYQKLINILTKIQIAHLIILFKVNVLNSENLFM